ncbi:adenylosuccinate synthetase, partial [Paenibacillus sepulcri]|nr:adenylosuccinate synthetase [Paenibacillus sepulcri]
KYGKFALRMLPSGVFYDTVTNVIGPGVALNISDLFRELEALTARGVPKPNLRISDRAQIVLPYHKQLDELEEQRLGDRKFGSTRSGIAPFYADKAAKLGIQTADLFHRGRLMDRLEAALIPKNVLLEHLYREPQLSAADMLEDLIKLGEKLRPYVCDTTELLQRAVSQGETIVAEGQLGALRDPDHGIYPYST